jgi:hypothetical protein
MPYTEAFEAKRVKWMLGPLAESANGLSRNVELRMPNCRAGLAVVRGWRRSPCAASGRGGAVNWELFQIKNSPGWWDESRSSRMATSFRTPSGESQLMNLTGRRFEVWEFRVSHEQLLLRSPPTGEQPRNIDLIFGGVDYVELPSKLGEIQVSEVTETDLARVRAAHKPDVRPDYVRVLVSKGRRYLVVAADMRVEENDLDLFESSLESFG